MGDPYAKLLETLIPTEQQINASASVRPAVPNVFQAFRMGEPISATAPAARAPAPAPAAAAANSNNSHSHNKNTFTATTTASCSSSSLNHAGSDAGGGVAQTRFERDFAHLRQSPFYQPPAVAAAPATAAPATAAPATAAQRAPGARCIIANPNQRGNRILEHIRSTNIEWQPIAADYLVGPSAAVFFVSVRYHLLKPTYMGQRLSQAQGSSFRLRVLLVHVDADDAESAVTSLNVLALTYGCTLVLAWSAFEAGRYLETFKAYESKPADAIRERVDDGYLAHAVDVLTSVRGVNKTDVSMLLPAFGTLAALMQAEPEELALVPGLGERKVNAMCRTLRLPFKRQASAAAAAATTAAAAADRDAGAALAAAREADDEAFADALLEGDEDERESND